MNFFDFTKRKRDNISREIRKFVEFAVTENFGELKIGLRSVEKKKKLI